MKAVMLSIQPKWCELIANGKKTIEVRKSAPKLQTPFKCYIYCTLSGCKQFAQDDLLRWGKGKWYEKKGKVIGEFVCDKVDSLYIPISTSAAPPDKEDVEKATCLSLDELKKYANGDMFLYGLHISDLKIYDKPKELGEFKIICKEYGSDNPNCDGCKFFIDGRSYEYDESDCAFAGHAPLTRPPQSWCYCEELSE